MVDYNISVVINPAGAQRGARAVNTSLRGVEANAKRLGGVLLRTFALVGAGVGFASSISTLRSFGQEMSTVRAITGANEAQFLALREEAKRLGATTRFSAAQAAEGMLFLARAGFTVDQVMASTEDSLRLAQAGALDLGSAADIASNILTAFRIDANDASRVVDVLALAANSANTNVGQLGQAMKFVGPVATGLGVSLEETTAAAAALSDAGLQGSMAGTGLRRVLSELESPSKKTSDILKSLGVNTEQVRVSQVGLTAALETMATAGVNTGNALEIFGDRGGPAFEVMAKSIPKIKGLTKELNNAGGTAQRVAEMMDDNLNGSILATKSAIEGFIIELGDAGATGALRSLFDTITAGFRSMSANIPTVLNVVDALSFALGVGLAAKAIPAVIAGMKALKIAMLANPVTALLIVITAVITALIAFQDEITFGAAGIASLGDVAAATWEAIVDGIKWMVGIIEKAFAFIADAIGLPFEGFNVSLEDVVRALAKTLDIIIGLFIGTFNAVVAIWNGLPSALEDLFVRGLNAVIAKVEAALNFIIVSFNDVLAFFNEDPFGTVIIGNITNGAEGAAEDLGTAVQDGFLRGLFAGNVEGVLDGILGRAEEIARVRVSGAGGPLAPLGDAIDVPIVGAPPKPTPPSPEFLERQAEILEEINGPAEDYALTMKVLDSLYASTTINAKQYADQVDQAKIAMLSASTEGVDGITRGLLKLKKIYGDTASAMEGVIVDAFSSLETLITDFITTGEANLGDFFAGISAELVRLVVQMAILKPLIASFGLAQGGIVSSGKLVPFASGGIINQPIAFPLNGGVGIAGEAGPEAIFPVKRMSDGELGIRGNVGQSVVIAPQVNITVEGGSRGPEADSALADRLGSQISAEVDNIVTRILDRERRPGGMLNPGRNV